MGQFLNYVINLVNSINYVIIVHIKIQKARIERILNEKTNHIIYSLYINCTCWMQ
jgi:hypothetical protein